MCLIKGGHDAEGNEKEKLDFKSIKKFVEINKINLRALLLQVNFQLEILIMKIEQKSF